MLRAAWRGLLLIVLGAAWPGAVGAQPSSSELAVEARSTDDADEAAYRQLVDSALAEYARANYLEARALFHKAHGMIPSARTLRALGLTEFELRNYRESARLLDEALRSDRRALSGALREDTERLLARAHDFFGSLRLRIRPVEARDVARVAVDEQAVPREAWEALSVDLGDHELTVQAPGFEPFRRTLHVVRADTQDVAIQLRALPALAARDDRAPFYKSVWLWTGAALVAGAVVATVFLVRRNVDERVADPVTTPNTQGVIRFGLGGL